MSTILGRHMSTPQRQREWVWFMGNWGYERSVGVALSVCAGHGSVPVFLTRCHIPAALATTDAATVGAEDEPHA